MAVLTAGANTLNVTMVAVASPTLFGITIPAADPYGVADGQGDVETFNPTLALAETSAQAYANAQNIPMNVWYQGSIVYTANPTTTNPTAPSISISPVSAAQSTARTVTIAGFQPNAAITLTRVGGGSSSSTANSSGGGTYSITPGEVAGSYTLQATDGYGHSASVGFTVTGTTVTSSISISPVSAATNTARTVTFTGFQPNATVNAVVYNGGSWTMTANSSGGGTYSIVFGDASGNHTVQATDSYGHTATANYTVT